MWPGLRMPSGCKFREEELLGQAMEDRRTLLRTKKLLDLQLRTLGRFIKMFLGSQREEAKK